MEDITPEPNKITAQKIIDWILLGTLIVLVIYVILHRQDVTIQQCLDTLTQQGIIAPIGKGIGLNYS